MVTDSKVIRSTGLAAVLAGLLFVVIQPLHPADVLASVSTDAWRVIHYGSLAMVLLFVAGIIGIYARQVEELGWVGLAGLIALSLGLLLTGGLGVVEVFVLPLLVESEPGFVNGFLGMVGGEPTGADLGVMPILWSASSVGFLAGTFLFGIANLRAGLLSRWASGIFAFGMLIAIPVVALLDMPRLTAVPIGIGLAWLGYSLWSEPRRRAVVSEQSTVVAQPLAEGI